MDYVTIDFEASCLPRHGRSFPIEVGISSARRTVSWLIRPDVSWADWDWSEEAKRLHGITPQRLERDGLPARLVLEELLAEIDGRAVIADSSLDSQWWNLLADAAGANSPSPILHVGQILDRFESRPDEIVQAQRHADWCSPNRHRAGDDAKWLRILLKRLELLASERSVPCPEPSLFNSLTASRRFRAAQLVA